MRQIFQDYKWLSPEFKRTQAIVKPMLEMLQEEGSSLRVLDVGCGDGTVSELIVKMGHKVWGIDENPEALKEAERRGIKTFEGDLEKDLPFENEFFDAIWCLRTLTHIFNSEHFLQECYRVLKKEGIIVITAENITSLANRLRVLFGLYPLWVAPSENYSRFVQHVRCYTKTAFEEVLRKTKFNVEKLTADFICFNPGPFNFPPWSESLGKTFPSLGETLIAKARKI